MSKRLEELRKINDKLDEQISEENQPVFTDMICYIRSADIALADQETVRRDLSEMIISAQNRGDNIKDVIGEDFKEFCDEVIANLPPKTVKEKWIERLDGICLCIAVLGTINLVFSLDFYRAVKNIITQQPTSFDIGITVGMLIATIAIMVISIFVVNRITRTALEEENRSNKSKTIITGAAVGAGIIAFFIITWTLGKQILFRINIVFALVILAALFVTHILLSKYGQ